MKPAIFAIIIGVVIFVIAFSRKRAEKLVMDFIMDSVSKKRIDTLHPLIKAKAAELLKRADERLGLTLRITEGYRPFERQSELFNYPFDGKDNNNNGIIDEPSEKVTNAKAGDSFHNYALAFDVVPIVNGKAIWDNNTLWEEIGKLGESLGLEWGGRWKFVDKPHFQIKNISLSHLKNVHSKGATDKDGYILLT